MTEILNTALYYIKSATLIDLLDIAITTYLIYYVLKLVQGTSVERIIKGIAILIALLFLSEYLELNVIHFVLQNTMQIGLVAVIIMFQPELRRLLESLGSSKLSQLIRRDEEESDMHAMIREIVDACSSMSWTHTGALIVFERKKNLDEIITSATLLDARPTSELIRNIFFVKAPLHDGAMIIREDRILAAGCVLPLTENEQLPKELGTRHRAGIGITEVSDAIVLIVSEETGTISTASGGVIKRNLTPAAVSNYLTHELIIQPESSVMKKRRHLFRSRKGEDKQ